MTQQRNPFDWLGFNTPKDDNAQPEVEDASVAAAVVEEAPKKDKKAKKAKAGEPVPETVAVIPETAADSGIVDSGASMQDVQDQGAEPPQAAGGEGGSGSE